MRELRDILVRFDALARAGSGGVLASVVQVEGSTYRRPGARMLVDDAERMIGLVSGGCLEGDLLEHARRVRREGTPRLVHYDHRGEDDVVWGLGLGCAGALDVLLEPVSRERPGPLAWIARWLAARRRGALATDLESGERFALEEGGDGTAPASGPPVPPGLDAALADALATGRPRRLRLAGRDLWVEVFAPPLRLAVFGAGPDAEPLVGLATLLGWDVGVTDPRPVYARPERFPGAAVHEAPAEEAVARLAPDPDTYAVVMTHHYLHDKAILAELLPGPAAYVGVLGPKRRTEDLLRDLEDAGVALPEERRARIFGPAGLDVGADAPEEIALSIAAEIQALAAGRSGGFLRDRKAPIHDPVAL